MFLLRDFFRFIFFFVSIARHTGKMGPRTLRWDPGPKTLKWDPMVGHYDGILRWNPKVRPLCRTLGWDPKVGTQGGTLRWEIKMGPQGGSLRWDSKVGPQCETQEQPSAVVLQNRCQHFAIFTGKYQCWNLLLINEAPIQVFSCEYCEIFKSSFLYRATLVAASGDVSKTVKSDGMKISCLNPASVYGCSA